jgi:hypothetical protein
MVDSVKKKERRRMQKRVHRVSERKRGRGREG